MLGFDYTDRTCVYFVAELEPQIRSLTSFVDAAEAVRRILKTPHFAAGPNIIILRDPERRLVIQINAQRIAYQTLGAKLWNDSQTQMLDSISAAVENIGSDKAKRIGFRIASFVQLKMTHPELVSLAFSAYAGDRESLQAQFGALDDLSVHLYGSRAGRKFRLGIVPQTAKDATKTLLSDPGLEAFLENKYLDLGVKEFHDRINTDCLYVDIDFWQEDVALATAPAFVSGAWSDTEPFLEKSINLIRAVPTS